MPDAGLDDFAHIAGVLAAVGLFVEMAGPTALMLSCKRVRTVRDWSKLEWAESNDTPAAAIARFRADPDLLLVHPVKLSAAKDHDGLVAAIAEVRTAPHRFVLPVDEPEPEPQPVEPTDEEVIRAEWPEFDPDTYLRLHPDVAAGGTAAFTHFRRHGIAEGRRWRE